MENTTTDPDVLERFLRYVQINTQSEDANCDQVPSSTVQFDLANVLSLSTVLSAVTIFSIIEVVLFTVLVVILTLLYNVVSTLVGGIHVTLGDD